MIEVGLFALLLCAAFALGTALASWQSLARGWTKRRAHRPTSRQQTASRRTHQHRSKEPNSSILCG